MTTHENDPGMNESSAHLLARVEANDPDRAGVAHLLALSAAGDPEAMAQVREMAGAVELANDVRSHRRLRGAPARAAREEHRRQLARADLVRETEADGSGARVPRARHDEHAVTDPRGYTARCWTTTCLRMRVDGPDGAVHELMQRGDNGSWDGLPGSGRADAFRRAVTRAEEWRREMDTDNETGDGS
jgi:hypothetical protein